MFDRLIAIVTFAVGTKMDDMAAHKSQAKTSSHKIWEEKWRNEALKGKDHIPQPMEREEVFADVFPT